MGVWEYVRGTETHVRKTMNNIVRPPARAHCKEAAFNVSSEARPVAMPLNPGRLASL